MDPTIISALIGAIAILAATVLAHHLKKREQRREESDSAELLAEKHPSMSLQEATARLADKAAGIGVNLGEVTQAPVSSFGTTAFCASTRDGKGALYCHASGQRKGHVYHVRGGIGWYYHDKIGGPSSFLGLPLSDEAPVAEGQRSTFEGGFIVWKSRDDTVSVYDTRARSGAKLVEHAPL